MINPSGVESWAKKHGVEARWEGGVLVLYDRYGKPYVYVLARGKALMVVSYRGSARYRNAEAVAVGRSKGASRNNASSGYQKWRLEGDEARAWLDADMIRLAAGTADRTRL